MPWRTKSYKGQTAHPGFMPTGLAPADVGRKIPVTYIED